MWYNASGTYPRGHGHIKRSRVYSRGHGPTKVSAFIVLSSHTERSRVYHEKRKIRSMRAIYCAYFGMTVGRKTCAYSVFPEQRQYERIPKKT